MEGDPQPIQNNPVRVVIRTGLPLKIFIVIFSIWSSLALILAGLWIHLDIALITVRIAPPKVAPAQMPTETQEENSGTSSLGGEIYTESSNPVDGKIPESPNPTPNPVEDGYKNPFNQ